MANSLDFSKVGSDLTKWIEKNPNFKEQIFLDNWDFFDYMTKVTGIVDQWLLGGVMVTEVVQPGQKLVSGSLFQPSTGALQPQPRTGIVRPGKVDLKFTSIEMDTMWRSYLGEMSGKKEHELLEMPFQAYFMSLILRKLKEDIRKKTLFKGIWNATGTAAVDVFDGVNALIAAGITAGDIPAGNVFTGTTPTVSNIIAQIKGVTNLVPYELRDEDMIVLISPQNKELYDLAYLAANNNLPIAPDSVKNGQERLDRTNFIFRPEISLSGSNKIIVTRKGNFEMGMQGEGDLSNVVVEMAERVLKIMIDFKLGIQYNQGQYIWTNDLA